MRTILQRLQEAGRIYQKPTREYFEADPVARQKWLQDTVPKIRSAIQVYRAILYCEDEASISLMAHLGSTWAPRGQTPKQKVTGKRGTVPVMSAINAQGRLVFRLYDRNRPANSLLARHATFDDFFPRNSSWRNDSETQPANISGETD